MTISRSMSTHPSDSQKFVVHTYVCLYLIDDDDLDDAAGAAGGGGGV